MNRQSNTSITHRSQHTLRSRNHRARLVSAMLNDKRFMYLEQIAMALLLLSLWLAVR